MCFASWVAPAKESVARYDNAEYITKIDDKYGYKACKAHLQNAYWIPMNERYNIKRMIQKHGCVTAGILYYPYDYMEKKSVNGKMDCYFYNPDIYSQNHDVVIVGWDDTIDKNIFKKTISGVEYIPEGNGAWLVKNSHGTSNNIDNDGYFWISYYDVGLLHHYSKEKDGIAFAYDFESVDNYDFNYQYDGTNSIALIGQRGITTIYSANIFTAQKYSQSLEAVGFYTSTPDMSYSVSIYKLDSTDSPIGGELVSEIKDGYEEFAGFHTVKLNEKVILEEGDIFSVVIKQSVDTSKHPGAYAQVYYEGTGKLIGVNEMPSSKPGQSFISYGGTDWDDMNTDLHDGNIRIKAYTNSLYDNSESEDESDEEDFDDDIEYDNDSDTGNTSDIPDVNVSYHTHIQTYGDSQGVMINGQMAGTSGEAKRLENIWIDLSGNSNLGVQYSTHCQSYGWMPWSCNGEISGTSGEAKRLEAIKIQLTGEDSYKYDIYYRVHAQSFGWLGWAKNGAPAGTAGYGKRLEGIQIVIVKDGEVGPGLDYAGINGSSSKFNFTPYISMDKETIKVPGNADAPIVSYKTHVQSYGWQNWVINGAMSGTSGKAKRLEGINIKVTNCPYDGDIVYTTHVQTYGWQGNPDDITRKGWKKNGEMSGTSGQAKRLEAICIDLTGEKAEHYDVYYRVHAQTFGWLGWAKNGEESGTAGYAKRLEGIQIVLVPKGGAAPGNNYGGITSKDTRAYISQ